VQAHVLHRFSEFLTASSFLIQKIVLAACLQKTGSFAHHWPPGHAKIFMGLAASRI
jgi:hypothetical protein